jgi:hypothetical protein
MRTVTAVLALAFISCSFGRASAAEAGFADSICPEATQYVMAVGKLRQTDLPQQVYDAAQAAVNAYARCSKDKLSNGFREAQHYADVRAAGLAVVASRALIALDRRDDARRELVEYRLLAQQVVDWDSETETVHNASAPRDMGDSGAGSHVGPDRGGSANGRQASRYRASAKEIVAAIDVELAKLGPVAGATPAH